MSLQSYDRKLCLGKVEKKRVPRCGVSLATLCGRICLGWNENVLSHGNAILLRTKNFLKPYISRLFTSLSEFCPLFSLSLQSCKLWINSESKNFKSRIVQDPITDFQKPMSGIFTTLVYSFPYLDYIFFSELAKK